MPISSRYPNPHFEPVGGRPYRVEPMNNFKREMVYTVADTLISQDFFDEIDRRTLMVNGQVIEVVCKADHDTVGAAMGEHARRTAIRNRRDGIRKISFR